MKDSTKDKLYSTSFIIVASPLIAIAVASDALKFIADMAFFLGSRGWKSNVGTGFWGKFKEWKKFQEWS
jgi:hypothetical protein